jgi:hypothetical protein
MKWFYHFTVILLISFVLTACQQTPRRSTATTVKKTDASLFLIPPRDGKSLCARPYKANTKRYRSISKRQRGIMLRGYSSEIAASLSGNWLKPNGLPPETKCQVLIMQRPDGCVRSIKFLDCPNTVMRRSVISALKKASPFPEAPHPDVYLDKIKFTFQR